MKTEPKLVINDPELVNELFTTKNKYFDKDPFLLIAQKNLMGKTIAFAQSTPEWAAKRKVITAALYKEKMI